MKGLSRKSQLTGRPPAVYLQSQTGNISLNSSIVSLDHVSTTSCPSLSPSPSPYARSVASEQDVDFCDPRNLTVGGVSATLTADFGAPASLEDYKGDGSVKPSSLSNFEFNPELSGLPAFDEFSDLESEEEVSGRGHRQVGTSNTISAYILSSVDACVSVEEAST